VPQVLDFAAVDDIALAAERGKPITDFVRTVEPQRIGPLVEYSFLREQYGLPALSTSPLAESMVQRRLAVEQMPEVLDAASKAGGNVHLAIAMAYYAGLRRSEITRLAWEHVDLEANLLTLPEEVTKTWRTRKVSIHPRLKAILLSLHGNRGTVRTVMRGNRADGSCDPDKLGKAVDREMQVRIGWRVGLQRLRRSFVTHLLNKGVPAWVVALLAGHSLAIQQNCYAERDGGKFADAINFLVA